jgi:hypothetical protein
VPIEVAMRVNELVLAQGIKDTRATLRTWNEGPWAVVRGWLGLSVVIALALLAAVFVVAKLKEPDPTRLFLPGYHAQPNLEEVARVLFRNSLVLALHAMACVAGFIAGSTLPETAKHYTGLWRWIHDKAGPLAIAFVIGATLFSLMTQAYVLGGGAADLSRQLGLSPAVLLATISIHALPELTALFLPLAAWTIASRRGEWDQLLAATFVTVALAVPVLIVTGFVEIYVTPKVLLELTVG